MRRPEDVIRKPYLTEKSNDEIAFGKYTFIVDVNSSKGEIKNAVEQLFNVKVLKVNTINYQGKVKRMGVHIGSRADWKKAIVKIDTDPNGTKTKNVRVKDEDGKIKTIKKEIEPNSYATEGKKIAKGGKKYKTSIEEFGVSQ